MDLLNTLKSSLYPSNPDEPAGPTNRGRKLMLPSNSAVTLTTKVVDYHGRNYLTLTNEAIEKKTSRNKRTWNQSEASSSESEDEEPLTSIDFAPILSPLAHPSEIVSHPAISRTYKSQVLNHMASDIIGLIEVEQNNLNWLNKLLQVLNGEDWYYLLEENMGLASYDHGLVERRNGEKAEEKNGQQNGQNDETEDPFFALPETLRRYEQNSLAEDGELAALKDELVNYLQVSIQRQHEYVKNLMRIRGGIVRADRLRRDLYKWGREMNEKRN